MFCSNCGAQVEDGDRFCKNCGAPLQVAGGVQPRHTGPTPTRTPAPRRAGARAAQSPYRDQIAQLRLQLKEVKLQLRDLNNSIRGTRSNYFELDSFAQRGPIREIGRMIEGAQLFGPYQRRKQLQDQILQMEQQLLALEQAQEQWRLQQRQMGQ